MEKKPTPNIDLFCAIHSTSETLCKKLNHELQSSLSISLRHFLVLRVCADGSFFSQKQLAQMTLQTEASMSIQIAQLLKIGLVEQTPDPSDRRKSQIRISLEGEGKLKVAKILLEGELEGLKELLAENNI
jgi:DNA-binding MarR family transcriptional regulator